MRGEETLRMNILRHWVQWHWLAAQPWQLNLLQGTVFDGNSGYEA